MAWKSQYNSIEVCHIKSRRRWEGAARGPDTKARFREDLDCFGNRVAVSVILWFLKTLLTLGCACLFVGVHVIVWSLLFTERFVWRRV